MRKIFLMPLCFLLFACAGTPKSDVAAIEASLTAADTMAIAYINLPLCGPKAPTLCSQKTIISNIVKASDSAYTAVKAAEASLSTTDITAAQNAVAALQQIVTIATGK